MALVAACAASRNAAFAETVKIIAFQGKSLLRPQAKVFIAPSATMITKAFQEPGFLAKPWPYREKGYSMLKHYWYEKTLPKFNENTKVIVVEGLEASGKTTLAKQIAEDFDLYYHPEPTNDQFFTNEYGFNLRELNPQLPPNARFINREDFFMEPTMKNATHYFTHLFQHSFMHYCEGMAHLLNTGQGVVMDRNYYSMIVDMLTLVESGWIRPEYKKYFNDCFFITKRNIIMPHLIIYLDVPVDTVKERIKKRGIDYEVETSVLSTKYLTLKDQYFKDVFLQDMRPHCEMLIYDWSNFGDAEVVSEDIEQIDFDKYGKYDLKLDDWRVDRERYWGSMRENMTSNHMFLLNLFDLEYLHIPEMWMTSDDWYAQKDAVMGHPTEKYAYGFNSHLGDKNVLFKLRYPGWKHNGIPM